MPQRRQFLLGACAALLPLPLLAQTAAQTQVQTTNVVDALAAAGNYDNFIEMVSRAGAVDTLRGAGPFTVLAPDNAAMAKMPNALREMLNPSTGGSGAQGQSPDRLRLGAFVNMHILEGRYTLAELMGRVTQVKTRNGNQVEFNGMQGNTIQAKIVGDSGFGVGGITIPLSPITLGARETVCSNGVLLPISEPLIQ
ncbi:fasciclin domain-containing protein [Sediminicoccus sp. KRV36]|uniref:fasciclin domain-containing protein n=1 Tax=Sediminicoccus sp. KRV36 TaxID=3133721 RepID=UPI00200EDC4A|nr:fasciclin domain-containing protein [Sediminicoccus rosea]UPY34953.1 fasciclin domain-containing protein [Sediminicoccus rosea]